MKMLVAGILVLSLLFLIVIVIKRRLGFGWLTTFGAHLTLSALAIYVINFSGFLPALYIPMNPMTVGTVMVLGVPGIALLLGLKFTLI